MLDLKEIVCTGDTLFRNERFMLDEMTYQDMLYFWNKKNHAVYFIIQKNGNSRSVSTSTNFLFLKSGE